MRKVLLLAAAVLGIAAVLHQGWDMFLRTPPRLMLQGSDDSFYYFWIRSAVIDGDFDFQNELESAPTMERPASERALAEPLTAAGRVRNKYPVGWAAASWPFFLAAHAIAVAVGLPADGWQPIYFVAIWLGHLGYTLTGLWAAKRVLMRFMDAESAAIGVLAGWLCSSLLYYQTARISMPHGLAFSLMALLYERSLRCQDDPGSKSAWLQVGALAGLLVITRPICAPYLLFPFFIAIRQLFHPAARLHAIRGLGLAAIAGAAFLALQLLAQRQVYGAWTFDTYDGETFHFFRPRIMESLFSPQHGWLYWHPFLLIGLGGFFAGVARGRFPGAWLAALVLVVYINSSWWCWWWGSSFGNRSFEGATLFAMAGWGSVWAWSLRPQILRRAVIAALALGVIANALLLGLFLRGAISRGDAVTYLDMWRALVRIIGSLG